MKSFAIGIIALVAIAAGGCRHDEGHRHHGSREPAVRASMLAQDAAITEAIAVMHPTANNTASGIVRFSQQGDSVKVVAEIKGLKANGTHGFHIHEFGDCSAPDATSAGGHYNPEGHDHAGPQTTPRHAGDFGNIRADASGVGRLELTVDDITINGQRNPILGRSVIVHEKADDLKSQPTGDAGGRISCGIIGIAKK
jgi:superoxide dismutase, Cu-Zn family